MAAPLSLTNDSERIVDSIPQALIAQSFVMRIIHIKIGKVRRNRHELNDEVIQKILGIYFYNQMDDSTLDGILKLR